MSQAAIDVAAQVGALETAETCQHVGSAAGSAACTVRQVLDRVASKWSIAIIVEASRGPVRFTALERSIEGISRRMLTLTLRNLERDGLLTRTVYPTVPPKVEYTATEMANELYETLITLTHWAERHTATIADARARYDSERSGPST